MRAHRALSLSLLLLAACGGKSDSPPEVSSAPPAPAVAAPTGPSPACVDAEAKLAAAWTNAASQLQEVLPKVVNRRAISKGMLEAATERPSDLLDADSLRAQVDADSEFIARIEATVEVLKTPEKGGLEALDALETAEATASKHAYAQAAHTRESRRANLSKMVELATSTGNQEVLAQTKATLAQLDTEAKADADRSPAPITTLIRSSITTATSGRNLACN